MPQKGKLCVIMMSSYELRYVWKIHFKWKCNRSRKIALFYSKLKVQRNICHSVTRIVN